MYNQPHNSKIFLKIEELLIRNSSITSFFNSYYILHKELELDEYYISIMNRLRIYYRNDFDNKKTIGEVLLEKYSLEEAILLCQRVVLKYS